MSGVLEFLTSTTLVDGIILFLVIETCVVCALRARSQTVNWYSPIARNAAGICLLFALRFALADAASIWMLLPLAGAFAAHLIDIRTQLPSALSRVLPQPKEMP